MRRHRWEAAGTRGNARDWSCSGCGAAACTWGGPPGPRDVAHAGIGEDCDLEAVRAVLVEDGPDVRPDDPSWS